MAKTLYLYTYSFPYGKGEAFLEEEVVYLSKGFSEIVILPLRKVGNARQLPDNVQVVDLFNKVSQTYKKVGDQLSFFLTAQWRASFLKDSRFQWSYCGEIIRKKELLLQYLKDKPKGIHYSYWFEEWSLILSLLSKNGTIDPYITRAHGFDLYEERAKLGFNPWRKLQFDQTLGVYPVSKAGEQYLRNTFADFKDKIQYSYLGTKDSGLSPIDDGEVYHLVSCSNVIPLKRVDRIVNVLHLVNQKVKWTHIGDGTEMGKVKELSEKLPKNITCSFLGSIDHNRVLDFYCTTAVDCFINLSTTEGLPVSMMEAISFGIPIIATDVGGVSEIVTKDTGALVPANFKDELLAEKFVELLMHVRESSFRNKIRTFWEENFSAEKNYPAFSQLIVKEYAV